MEIKRLVVGPVSTNCYFLANGNKCVVVDPGGEFEKIVNHLDRYNYEPVAILLTHGHFDHIMAVNQLKEKYDIKVYAYKGEAKLIEDPNLNCSISFGYNYASKADVLLEAGEEIELAGMLFKTIHTPGHTAGSCCYYMEEEKVLLSGDTLFYGSIGRCDLPTGDEDALINSLLLLMKLPHDVVVYSGHGGKTTIGYENEYNPYIRG